MRIYTKYGQYRLTSLAFYNELLGQIPDLTVDKIDQHTQLYKTYLELTASKKYLISEYKSTMKEIRNARAAGPKTDSTKPASALPRPRS